MSDGTLTLGLIIAFTALVTVHVATLFGLARRRHFAQALAAFALPPLAPYWAFTRGMQARAVAWIASAAVYAVAFLLSR